MSESLTTEDSDLRAQFESCSLPQGAWTHRAHLRMAYLYALSLALPDSIARIRAAIKRFNASKHVPETLERGYHETITVAFMRLVHHALSTAQSPFCNSDEFCDQNPHLLNKDALAKHYSRELLRSHEAKHKFVEPDRESLPDLLQTPM